MKDENRSLERARSRLGLGEVIVNQDASGVNDSRTVFSVIISDIHLRLGLFLNTLAKSKRLADKFKYRGPMREPVQ